MKKWFNLLLVTAAILFSANYAQASHIAGADISYQCLGGDTFKITINVFRDCSGISAPTNINNSVTISSSCGSVTPNFVLTNPNSPLSNANNGTEVSQLCGSALPNSACSGGSLPGMVQLIFEAIVVLPPCADWTIGYDVVCCRNTNVNLGAGSADSYVETTLNNLVDSCNTGPAFDAQPIPYVCAGQPVVYNFGAVEPDGDSLAYSFVCGFNAAGTPLTYAAGYSCTSPITGATINSQTGEVIFTPVITGNFVLVVQVEEYDENGVLLSTTMRDILFVVQICSNQQPTPQAPITNFIGTGALVDSNSVEVCVGENFTMSVMLSDPNQSDSLSIRSNIDSILPGANYVVNYPGAPNRFDTAIVTFNWTAVPVNGSFYPFFIEVNDNACPIPGLYYATFDVTIVNSTFAFPNQTICQFSQQANLNVVGGDQFNWVALPGGDPIVVGPPGTGNFSCDTCQYPQAYPAFTTCYEVTSNLSGSCNPVDTVCVYVAPDYNINISNDTLICSVAEIQLFAQGDDPSQNYSYNWSPNTKINNTSISNPKVNPDATTTYSVTAVSDSGCVKSDDVVVQLSPPFPAENRILASDTIVCLQDTVNLAVQLGDVTPANCGPTANQCVGNTATVQIGNGTAQNFAQSSFFGVEGYPAPFGGDDGSAKHQFLYRASDMQAAGLQGGSITALAFNIVSNNGPLVYNDYTIKIGCTSKNALTTSWEGGLIQVFNPKPVFPTPGWVTLPLDQAYDWDGQSNLVVEICFDNQGVASQNAVSQHTVTNYNSCSFVGGAGNVCNSFVQDPASPIQKLPNIRFTMCSGVDPNAFSFDWLGNVPNLVAPSTVSSQSIDLGVNLTTPGSYTVAIADTYGVCFDTLGVNMHVVSNYDATPDAAGPFCITSPYHFMSAFTPYNVTTPGGKWSGPGIIDDTLGLFDPGPSGAGFGMHWIKYSITGDACAAADSIQVEVVPAPDASITTSGPFCELDTAVLISGVNPGKISSTNPNIAKGIIDTSGLFDISQIPQGLDSLILTWTAFGQACNNDTTIKFELTPQFDSRIASPGSFCPHDTVAQLFQIDSISGGNWTGNGILNNRLGLFDPSQYSGGDTAVVTLDSIGLCGNSNTIVIQIDTLPQIGFTFDQGGIGPYCKNDGSTVVFGATPINDPLLYGTGTWNHVNNWTGNGVSAFNTNNPIPAAGTYLSVYTFEDLNGCLNSDSIEFVIGQNPPNPLGTREFFCTNEFINGLMVDTSDASVDTANTFVWYTDPDLTDSVGTGFMFDWGRPSAEQVNFYVKQISPEGCESTGYGFVQAVVSDAPEVSYDPSTDEGIEPLTINFINTTQPDVDNYAWFVYDNVDFDWILESDEKDFTYVFEYDDLYSPGPDSGYANYLVLLTGINEFGCVDSFFTSISVDAVSELQIPNIFTPNGDGFNDVFAPTIAGLREFEGKIFNKWGRRVAELSLSNPTWDGTDPQTSEISDGVYYYVITAVGNNGEEYNEKGNVTVIQAKQ